MSLLKIIGVVGGVAGVLLSASSAFAESNDRAVTATTTKNVRMETVRIETKAKIEDARKEAKTQIENAREETKTRIETAREEAKTRMEAQREKAKERLADIRDKKKQELALKLAEQFDKLNKKWTDHFIQQLDHYDSILLKIKERADIAATNGKNIASTTSAIQSANTAIASARTAVVAQAAKTYTLNTSTVTTTVATTTVSGQDELMKGLRTAFQDLHKTLFKDLFAVRDGVMKNARAAVRGALQALIQIPNVDDDDENDSD
jgi:F0F1-type ATP synthase membrane subunit b/b'